MHSIWLSESVSQELRPHAVVSPNELRDLYVAVLDLFQIEAQPVGDNGFTVPETVDDRDGPLLDTLLDLVQARFPPIGSPAADAFARNSEGVDGHDGESF